MMRQGPGILLAALLAAGVASADDLNPVTLKAAPAGSPVVLVQDGQGKASICVMADLSDRVLKQAVDELQECIELTTGAKLPVVQGKAEPQGIVIGDCAEAAKLGLVGSQMPIEGFAIRTAPGRVFIVGHDAPVGDGKRAASNGTAWGVFEFLERFVGVRWYWPTERGGRSIIESKTLAVGPVWLEDAPVYRKREIWPPMANSWNGTGQPLAPLHTRLRAGNSWPTSLVVHSPNWSGVKDYVENRPECFQLGSDGTRNFQMLCYGNPRTLATYLEEISAHFDRGEKAHMGIAGDAITVSPNDAGIACTCPDCRRLWDPAGGQYGTASKILATFVDKLAREVKRRWPDKTVIFLPYLNYTAAPEGFRFPGNVEVQLCGMPGIAQYKEPAIAAAEQANIDRWVAITGRKIQNWHYSCWPADKTKAPYQYPHVVKDFYLRNRDKLIGSFINGEGDHFPRFATSLYCWMKVLWNPAFDVDAAMDAYCRRMFGPAAATVRELLRIQTDGWEKSRWPEGRLSPKAIYETSYPPETVKRMKALLEQARREAAADPLARERVEYYATPFPDFLAEFEAVVEGKGARSLVAKKVAENPVIDGKLDDAAWQQAEAVALVKGAGGKEVEPKYPTKLKAVWTMDGITFGFWMAEPSPATIVRTIKARDESMAWWNDCVELFLDVTGKNEGEWYQFIVNANGLIHDSRNEDPSWNAEGVRTAAHIGADFWSIEVYVPYAALKGYRRPGTGVAWYAQFTRHRMSDYKANKESLHENQRLNARFGGPNRNLADFAPLKFVE